MGGANAAARLSGIILPACGCQAVAIYGDIVVQKRTSVYYIHSLVYMKQVYLFGASDVEGLKKLLQPQPSLFHCRSHFVLNGLELALRTLDLNSTVFGERKREHGFVNGIEPIKSVTLALTKNYQSKARNVVPCRTRPVYQSHSCTSRTCRRSRLLKTCYDTRGDLCTLNGLDNII